MRIFDGEPFERIIGLCTALVVIFTASVAYLEADADARAGRAERTAQQIALEGMGARARGEIQIAFALQDAARAWEQYDNQAIGADIRNEFVLLDAYEAARDRTRDLTPLLQDPYFDTGADFDILSFEADILQREAALMSARFETFAGLEEAWEAKAQNYVTQLTVLAVSLFLFGLSITIPGVSRYIFVGFAGILAVITVSWTVTTLRTPVTTLSDEILIAFADAETLAFREAYDEALAAYDDILDAEPNYVRALIGRADTLTALGENEAAIEDYERIVDLGAATPQTLSDLGYSYYTVGRFDEALSLTEARVTAGSTEPLDAFDYGLILLTIGDTTAAREAYERGLTLATDQILTALEAGTSAPSTVYNALENGTFDLEAAITCRTEENCDDLAGSEAYVNLSVDEATRLVTWLKDHLAALTFGEQPGAYPADRELVTLTIADPTTGETVDRLAGEITDFIVDFTRIELAPTDQLLIKTFVDGEEDQPLRQVFPAGNEVSRVVGVGEASAYQLYNGEYQVELYRNYQLVGTAAFAITEADGEFTSYAENVTDDNTLYSYVPPDGWSPLEEEDGLFFTEPDDFDAVGLVFTAAGIPPEDIAEAFDEIYGGTATTEPTPTTIAGRPTLRFTYTFEDDDGFISNGDVVIVTLGDTSLFVTVEVFEDGLDATELLDEILVGITLE